MFAIHSASTNWYATIPKGADDATSRVNRLAANAWKACPSSPGVDLRVRVRPVLNSPCVYVKRTKVSESSSMLRLWGSEATLR
jgi:hypothetical protein